MNVTDFVRDNTNFTNRNSNNLFRLNCSTDVRFSMIQRAAQNDEYFLQFLMLLSRQVIWKRCKCWFIALFEWPPGLKMHIIAPQHDDAPSEL